jgi:hypothetical protein
MKETPPDFLKNGRLSGRRCIGKRCGVWATVFYKVVSVKTKARKRRKKAQAFDFFERVSGRAVKRRS